MQFQITMNFIHTSKIYINQHLPQIPSLYLKGPKPISNYDSPSGTPPSPLPTHVTLSQGYETFLGHGQQLCKILSRSNMTVRCYGQDTDFGYMCSMTLMRWMQVNRLFNVTINNTSVIHVTAHRCAGGLKKKWLDLRLGFQRHRHFVGFFNVPVQAPTRDQPFYTVIQTHRPN